MPANTLKHGLLSIIVFCCSVLVGCATHPDGVMHPIGKTVEGASTVNILVDTTRAPTTRPGFLFSGERASGHQLAEVVVSIPPEAERKVGRIQWPRSLVPDPAKSFATVSVNQIDDKAARDWFRQSSDQNGRLLIFVHGFNTPFGGGLYLLAQIVHDSKMNVAPLYFSWPSRGKVFAYNYDKESAAYSRDALEHLISIAAADADVKDITILAHSMGCWLTMEALRSMALHDGRIAGKVHNVILASPDIDVDVFRSQYYALGETPPKMTLFISRDDNALRLSRFVGGNIDRVGAVDIGKEPYRSALEKATGVSVIDLSEVKAGNAVHHAKFAESPEIVRVLGDSLINGQPLADQNLSLRDQVGVFVAGVTHGVGRTAETVADTPFALTSAKDRQDAHQDRVDAREAEAKKAAKTKSQTAPKTTEAEPLQKDAAASGEGLSPSRP